MARRQVEVFFMAISHQIQLQVVLPVLLLSLFSHFLAILKDVRRCQDQR